MSKFKTYTLKRRKGIDDLQSVYAFVGNSQGNESASNEISDYIASQGWMSFIFEGIDKTNQEAIYAEAIRRSIENGKYINKLKEEGRYGEEYEIKLELIHNPLFDDREVFIANPESCRIEFIGFSNKKNEQE